MIWCLTGMASLCWVGERALGQAGFEVPQYPQYVQYPQGAPPVTPAVSGAQVSLTADQIDQLLGPIALYPDPLLSLIFPAATYPQDVAVAEQWLAATPSPTEADIAAQSWDASIKGLVHYPTVLAMMSGQIDWTQAVGAAFVNQQKDVLNSVQRLRAQAQAAQNLQTTSQEQVLADNGAIRIEPVDPDVMYVPQYDPNLVYTTQYPISFGIGFPIGLWCDDDFDWNDRYITYGGGWYRGWRHPVEWDQHPPAWDRHPTGWVAAPQPWARTALRPAPRLTTAVVSHLGLDRPRGTTVINPAVNPAVRPTVNPAVRSAVAPAVKPAPSAVRQLPAPLPIGKVPVPAPSKNAFDPATSRTDVQHAVQRVAPTPSLPAASIRPAVTVTPQPAPRPSVVTPMPRSVPTPSAPRSEAPVRVAPVAPRSEAPIRAAPVEPRVEAPAAPRSAPSNVFSGGSAGATRAQSVRGNTSVHR